MAHELSQSQPNNACTWFVYMLFVNKLSSTCIIWNEHARDTNWRWRRIGYNGSGDSNNVATFDQTNSIFMLTQVL